MFSDFSSLASSFEVSIAATLYQGTTLLQSNSVNNFTNPVIFTVQAEDGTRIYYKVIVIVTKSNETKLLSFGFMKVINKNANVTEDVVECLKNTTMTLNLLAIDLNFPNNVALVPSFTISKGAKLLIDGNEIESDKTAFKFLSNTSSITIKAQDGTEQKYGLNLTSQILNIEDFLKKCPTEDSLFEKFSKDFEIRKNGVVVTNFNYSDKFDVTLRIM